MAPNEPIVLGVLGMPGAGKSVLAELLGDSGVPVFRLGQIVVEEVRSRGLPLDSAGEAIVRRALREEEGNDVLAKRAIDWIRRNDTRDFFVIDGVYSPDEESRFRAELGIRFFTVAVVCDKDTRFSRLDIRKDRPLDPRSADERDRQEVALLHKGDPIALADYFCLNNRDRSTFLVDALSKLVSQFNICDRDPGGLTLVGDGSDAFIRLLDEGLTLAREETWMFFASVLALDDPYLNWRTAEWVAQSGQKWATSFLLALGRGPDKLFDSVDFRETSVHLVAAMALGRVEAPSKSVLPLLHDSSAATRQFAADALGQIGDPSVVEALVDVISEDPDDGVAEWAGRSIARLSLADASREWISTELSSIAQLSSGRRRVVAFFTLHKVDDTEAEILYDRMTRDSLVSEDEAREISAFM